MCIIVDANVMARVLLDPTDSDFAPVHRALSGISSPSVKLVYGGSKLLREYARNTEVRRQVASLDRAGRAVKVADAKVDAEEKRVQKCGIVKSDDEHVLALARVTGARLLCSHDGDLITDFTNVAIVSAPRGKVYKKKAHSHLLRGQCGASRS